MKREPENHISMKSIRGRSKMCCQSTEEFRNDVIILARKHGSNLQEFLLECLREKVEAQRKGARSLPGRRSIALERLFANRRASQDVKDAIDGMLKKYMPEL